MTTYNANVSPKSRMVDAILCWFLGCFGAHKFYEGKIGMGILYIFTFGLFGIGALVDFIMILAGSGVDADGKPIKVWLDDTGASCGPTESSSAYVTPAEPAKPSEDDKIATLSKYKDLLDKGIITQEEFDKKKEELLK
jgi:TM2 domain-containing membrane protein YozV